MYFIFINTLKDGRFEFKILSRLSLSTNLNSVGRRMQALAKKYFGENALRLKDRSMLGYWADKKTGQTIEVSHEEPS